MNNHMDGHDIFISYSRKDLKIVKPFVHELESHGIRVWMDLSNIDYGVTFPDKIADAIDNSDSLIFMCTSNSLSAPYCKKELGYARNNGKKIRVILVDGVMPKKGWFALDYQDINCVNFQKEEQVQKLFLELDEKYSDGITPPPSPPSVSSETCYLTKLGIFLQYFVWVILGIPAFRVSFLLNKGILFLSPYSLFLVLSIVGTLIATYYLSQKSKKAFYAVCILDFIELFLVCKMGNIAYHVHPAHCAYSKFEYINLWGLGEFIKSYSFILTYMILSAVAICHISAMFFLLQLKNKEGSTGWSQLQ